MLLVLIVTLVVIVVRITTVAVIAVAVAVLFAFSIARRPLFVVPGTVSLLAVRTTIIVLFITAPIALLIRGMVFLIGR